MAQATIAIQSDVTRKAVSRRSNFACGSDRGAMFPGRPSMSFPSALPVSAVAYRAWALQSSAPGGEDTTRQQRILEYCGGNPAVRAFTGQRTHCRRLAPLRGHLQFSGVPAPEWHGVVLRPTMRVRVRPWYPDDRRGSPGISQQTCSVLPDTVGRPSASIATEASRWHRNWRAWKNRYR